MLPQEDIRESNPLSGTCEKCAFPVREEDFYEDHFSKDFTCLMFAAFMGYEQCVKDLIAAGAKVNVVDDNGNTALIFAVKSGYEECVNTLLEAGVSVNKRNRWGDTALIFAILYGHSQCVEILLKAGADVNQCNKTGYTALMIAALVGHSQCIEILLKSGANVNHCNKDGDTALVLAALKSHNQCVEILLEAGADVNKGGENGNTALMVAAQNGHSQCVEILLKEGAEDRKQALIIAVQNKYYESVDLLLKAGADVNLLKGDDTLLHYRSNTQIVQSLLRARILMNRKNRKRCNALKQLIMSGGSEQLDMAFLLLAAGETFTKTSRSDTCPPVLEEWSLNEVKCRRKSFFSTVKKGIRTVLFAHSTTEAPAPLLEKLILAEIQPGLKNLCREAIRKHLLKLNPHENLFLRIPQLKGEIPTSLMEYLLYDMSIETNYNDDCNRWTFNNDDDENRYD